MGVIAGFALLVVVLVFTCVTIDRGVNQANAGWRTNDDRDEPAIVFDKSEEYVWFRVFRFYDTQFRVLCYTTSASMECIPLGQLTQRAKVEIKQVIERSKIGVERPPRIIKLP